MSGGLPVRGLLDRAIDLHRRGALREAEAVYHQALTLDPENAEAMAMLGTLALQAGRNEAAAEMLAAAVARAPLIPRYHNHLGVARARQGRADDAEAAFRRALSLDVACVDAMNNLALLLAGRAERLPAAVALWRDAIRQAPGDARLHLNLGVALERTGRLEAAAEEYRAAAGLRPDYPLAFSNLAMALNKLGRLREAQSAHQRAMELAPEDGGILDGAAASMLACGRVADAIDVWRRAVAVAPGDAAIGSNLLLAMHYDEQFSPQALWEAHRQWAARHAEPHRRSFRPHDNDPRPDRRLRIGYVSADLRRHAVATFLQPIFDRHDRGRFEIVCYSGVGVADDFTQRFRARADGWREVASLGDDALAEQIRGDRIDILVDLSGHIAGNRLCVFARKPAPVQVTYLGYPDTTGVDAVDYRFTDAVHDPPNETDAFHAERLIRLEPSAWCYRPPEEAGEVSTPPFERAGFITFGSLHNNAAKLTAVTAEMWGEILSGTPTSRLLILAHGGEEGAGLMLDRLRRRGIARDRIEVVAKLPPRDYLALFSRVDLSLDPFPYNGHTTTLDSSWMGVPTVTLAGQAHVSRAGASVMRALGLAELVATTPAQYIDLAVGLAQNPAPLAELRGSMRQRMERSPVRDERAFTAQIEDAYRRMWRAWCSSIAGSGG